MISVQVFMFGMLGISLLTGLVTEAVKKILAEHNKSYHANTLAGIIAGILSIAVSIFYVIITDGTFTNQTIACVVAMVFMSWLCAMVGYDKVIQTISQLKK